MKLAIIISLSLLSVIAVPVCSAESAEQMLSSCKAVTAATITESSVIFVETFESGVCWGAFGTLIRALQALDSENRRPLLGVCLPAKATRTEIIAVFVEYSKRHPERYHEDFFLVALNAAHEAFPCAAK